MRGTQVGGGEVLAELGIIPADAGNTAKPDIITNMAEDHPRGCGEHLTGPNTVSMPNGSSPRMRGTHGVFS